MSVRGMLGAMVAGTALVMIVGARPAPALAPEVRPRPTEAPWLTREAAVQLVGQGGSLGPLFDGLELGGPAPSAAVRARIAAFAQANRVELALDVIDGELAAIRFAVTFGGCCGYEGADVLALRMGRPKAEDCCGCGFTWIDDWAVAGDAGVHLRARVRVNRVEARLHRTLSLSEVLDEAERLLGAEVRAVREAAGDRWTARTPGRYVLELPFRFGRDVWYRPPDALHLRDDLGIELGVEDGRIVEVVFALREEPSDEARDAALTLRARWGRPSVAAGVSTWRRPDRVITAELAAWPVPIAIRKR